MNLHPLPRAILLGLAVATAACSTPPTVRVPPSSAPMPPPPPRPQVMLGETAPPSPPPQRTLRAMSEEERTERLRDFGSPIRPYSPAPFYSTRVVYQDARAESYETVYYGPSAWDRARPWVEMGAAFAFMSAPFWFCGFD